MVGGITLTESQETALRKILSFSRNPDKRIFILRGYAGTGKTTLVKALVEKLKSGDLPFTILASTGRAAKVLRDMLEIKKVASVSQMESNQLAMVRTIHSEIYDFQDLNQDMDLFGKQVEEQKGEIGGGQGVKIRFRLSPVPPSRHLYIVDESSMIGDSSEGNISQAVFGDTGRLLSDLLDYNTGGSFLFIGDPCQLPPVSRLQMQDFSPALTPDYFLQTFGLDAESYDLTEIVRQADGIDIPASAAELRHLFQNPPVVNWAKFPMRGYRNIHLVYGLQNLLSQYIACIYGKRYDNATLIVRSNREATEYSLIVRRVLGFGAGKLAVGELLLVTQNNQITGLVNGDLVEVVSIGNSECRVDLTFLHVQVKSTSTGRLYSQLLIENLLYSAQTNLTQEQQTKLWVDFHIRMSKAGIKQSNELYAAYMQQDEYLNALRCVFGYALTCHKAQGGEWNKVFLSISRRLSKLAPFCYQWVYTAMTRAKEDLYVVDDFFIS